MAKPLFRFTRFQRFQTFLHKEGLHNVAERKDIQKYWKRLEKLAKHGRFLSSIQIALYVLLFSSVIAAVVTQFSYFKVIGELLGYVYTLVGSTVIIVGIFIVRYWIQMNDMEQEFYISTIISKIFIGKKK
jgi:hypothetical protein